MVKPLEVSIHWLGITGHFDPLYMVKAFYEAIFASKYPDKEVELYPFDYIGASGRGYQHIYQWSGTGAYLYVNPLQGTNHCHLELRGNFCEAFQGSLPSLFILIQEAASEASLACNSLTDFNPNLGKLNAARVDIAFDHVPFTPQEQFLAFKSGEVVTRCRAYRWLENEEGNTFYVGSSKSDRLTRCYDRRGFTRLELQLRNAYAGEVVRGMLDQSPWLGIAVSFLRGHADYTAPWWQSVVGDALSKSIPTIKLLKPTVDDLRNTARKRVRNTIKEIAPLVLGLGMDLRAELSHHVYGFDDNSGAFDDGSDRAIRLACALRGIEPTVQNFRNLLGQYEGDLDGY
jgi:Replication initiation factor